MFDIPSELLLIIFLRFSAECLMNRLRYVCMAWRSSIDDPYFIKSHNARWINQEDSSDLYLLHLNNKSENPVLSLNSLNYSNLNSIQFNSQIIPRKFWAAGSKIFTCNGLLLIYKRMTESCSWWILNPITRENYELPPLDGRTGDLKRIAIGFGYDFATDDYKIVTHNEYIGNQKFKTYIYSLKLNQWKQFKNHCFSISYWGRGVFCNGALHWIGRRRLPMQEDNDNDSERMIVALDLKSEEIRFYSKFPRYTDLGELGRHLSLCEDKLIITKENHFYRRLRDIQIMGSYGDEDSWLELHWETSNDKLKPISYSASKELLLLHQINSNKFICVDLKHNTRNSFEIPISMCSPQIFRPSLVRIILEDGKNKRKLDKEEAKNESQQ